MPTYNYDLSSEQPSLYRRLSLPVPSISITYHSIEVCDASIHESGEIVMELPEIALRKLESGEAIVRPYVVPAENPVGHKNQEIQLIRIVDLKKAATDA